MWNLKTSQFFWHFMAETYRCWQLWNYLAVRIFDRLLKLFILFVVCCSGLFREEGWDKNLMMMPTLSLVLKVICFLDEVVVVFGWTWVGECYCAYVLLVDSHMLLLVRCGLDRPSTLLMFFEGLAVSCLGLYITLWWRESSNLHTCAALPLLPGEGDNWC